MRVCAIGLLVLTGALRTSADEKLTMTVWPAVAFAPATLIVRAHIESDSRNRAVEIVAESTDFYRSSEIQLDGDNAPVTNTFEFRSLPPGSYNVTATLFATGGQMRATARSSANIMGGGGR
jgi:hypothetical protein